MEKIILILFASLMIFSLVGCGKDNTVYNAAYFKDNPKGIELISSDKYDAYSINVVFGKKGFEPKLQMLIEENDEGLVVKEVNCGVDQCDLDIKVLEEELNFYGLDFYFFNFINDKSAAYIVTKNAEPYELVLDKNYIRTVELHNSEYPDLNIWVDYTLKHLDGELIVENCQIRANHPVEKNLDRDETMALMGKGQGYISGLAKELMDGSNDYQSDASCGAGSLSMRASSKPKIQDLFNFIK